MKSLMYFAAFLTLMVQSVALASGPLLTAKLQVAREDSIPSGREANVDMIANLYANDTLVQPQPNYLYRWWRRNPNVVGQAFYLRDSYTGTNGASTHVYFDSTDQTAGMFDYYCIIKGYGGDTNTVVVSDTIRVPWYTVYPAQKRFSGSSYGTVRYWNSTKFKANHAIPDTFFVPRYNPKLLLADTSLTPDRSEKYHHFFDPYNNNYWVNHMTFVPPAVFSHYTSQFAGVQPSVSIRAQLIDAPAVNGGTIQFQDPWLLDLTDTRFNDPPYGYRNLSMDAPFKV